MNNGSRQTAGIKEIGMAGSERSESGRNAEPAAAAQDRAHVPDPQVLEHPERRRFTVDYKARIVREADACTEHGQIGALLRREGLYSGQLSTWRKIYRNGALAALKDDKRGRKQLKHPLEKENEKLKKDNVRLERRLSQAEAVIDIQKKLSEILGVPLTGIANEGDE
jgi:transposase-like protein